MELMQKSPYDALCDKHGKAVMKCSPTTCPEDVPFSSSKVEFIPKGSGPKLFSMALIAFAVLFSIGAAIGVAISNGGGTVHASTGGGNGGNGISTIVLVFSIIGAFALGGFLTSIFLGGGFDFLKRKKTETAEVVQ